ncbi:ankyrin repeat and protein kinase domain-containing protein 1 isoform X2 [Parasteatoda tepidariorum]|uniref:ankyrin repeat and protein kinase domain-containing protein 1 isoform X2 n=1 Tax=Parasteatoda tepidariorum TaxID=114398 RepID=UPI00077FD81F|nr:ankyrin repeat and SOCS box protein 8 [Parasteatoda tepidariorum]
MAEEDETCIPEDPILRQIADCICTYASLDEIRMLLSEGVDVNEPLDHGRRLLQFAVYHRHVDAMTLLLVRGAHPSLMDEKGYTPMHNAAQIGFCNVIRILLSYNARVNFTKLLPGDIGYCYPPRASPAEEPLRLALKNGYLKAAELLLKHGANPNAEYYSGFEINFIDPTDVKAVELLLQYGANPNARDRQGITLLMKACRNPGGLECAKILIAHGADVNAITDEEQRTPLHCAVLSGNIKIVELLVAKGAQVKLPPYYTKPPPFFFALLKSDFSMMKYLIELGTDINQGSAVVGSCLHVALTELGESKVAVVRFLLENGADPNAILTLNGRTVLKPPLGEYLVSVTNHNINIVRMLLRYGARVVLMGQRQHPLGILLGIHHIDSRNNDELLELVASAAEAFCVSLIDNSLLMSKRHKLVLLQRALTPLPLKHCARIALRNYLGWGPKLIESVDALYLPIVLKRYLLYED